MARCRHRCGRPAKIADRHHAINRIPRLTLRFATTHNAPEPAEAIAPAGLLAEQDLMTGRRVAVIQTGGNADSAMFADVLTGHSPAGGAGSGLVGRSLSG